MAPRWTLSNTQPQPPISQKKELRAARKTYQFYLFGKNLLKGIFGGTVTGLTGTRVPTSRYLLIHSFSVP